MRNGTAFHPFANLFDSIRPASEKIGKLLAMFAVGMYERLDQIAENTGDRTTTFYRLVPLTFTGAAEPPKEIEIPPGQEWVLTSLAQFAAGGTEVRISANGQARFVKAFTTPDTIGPDALIVTNGGVIAISSTVAATLALTFRVTMRNDPKSGVSGEQHPAGLHTNHMALAIEQHFPGVLDVDEDPYDLGPRRAPGTIYGAGPSQEITD